MQANSMAFQLDIERLILEVEKRPAIWDTSGEDNKNKHTKIQAWVEVCPSLFEGYEQKSTTEKTNMGKFYYIAYMHHTETFYKHVWNFPSCSVSYNFHLQMSVVYTTYSSFHCLILPSYFPHITAEVITKSIPDCIGMPSTLQSSSSLTVLESCDHHNIIRLVCLSWRT